MIGQYLIDEHAQGGKPAYLRLGGVPHGHTSLPMAFDLNMTTREPPSAYKEVA